ncbi:hypothetical protein GCM10023310_71840 [Paenibacillus vulneris]|uniref:Amino acid transporter n=1 Tax=Paenibacillus vulneris TaxID=1133364 RepID=A0ABW3UZ21_9BACL|nr:MULTISPECIES: hypothetical protein [unclassified Paenibacillus]MBE1446606.1 hypothetical protein [Paenibacillus sp. OAS669]
MTKPLHETQPDSARVEKADYINPLQDAQPIQNGGSSKKADIGSMPSPIRYFGYFFFTSAAVVLLVGLLIQFLK